MNLGDSLKKAGKFVVSEASRHMPEILIGISIPGMITTTVLAVKHTPEAMRRIEQRKKELGVEKLTIMETVKTAWKCYIPSAVVGTATAGCMIGSCVASNRKSAALATALSASERAIEEYSEKVTEMFGEGADEKVKEAVAADRQKTKESPIVMVTGKGACLFWDDLTQRYFLSDPGAVGLAFGKMNAELFSMGELDVNSYCYYLGMPAIEGGNLKGWRVEDGCIEPYHDSKLQEDTDIPCHVIGFYPSGRPKNL
jgi:hypothetical protein